MRITDRRGESVFIAIRDVEHSTLCVDSNGQYFIRCGLSANGETLEVIEMPICKPDWIDPATKVIPLDAELVIHGELR